MYRKRIFILFSILLIILLSLPACFSNQEEIVTTDKGNPKLSGHLKRLIQAEERGEAEEFAEPRGIELIDGSVRVIIECESGQVEAVAKEASTFGTVELIYKDWLQVVAPITSLTALADIPGAHLVRLPWVASEE